MTIATQAFDLPPDVLAAYTYMRRLPDGRICGVHRLLMHWTMHVGIDEIGYAERYCYRSELRAIRALKEWNGTDDPEGWHRHPTTGRRRDPETGREWIAW